MARTYAELSHQPAHRSFAWASLKRRAGTVPVEDWLIHQANVRNFRGAALARPLEVGIDESVTLVDIVVELLAPQAEAEGRALKLILRILQSGQCEPGDLARKARQERADHALWWLLQKVPAEERNAAVDAIALAMQGPPRGWHAPDFDYDSRRLLHRPGLRAPIWKARQS